ncbi:hypothetical protein FAL77_10070 [Listeria monocytogenes]|uniref:Uncharacterized protein n=1 Tax=Listeria monocytogenes TaxID=1639 RepID=A0A9P1WTP5_LISMN|nr:hypothetical protein [Listeria monocytogenes]EAC2288990.1 hypothetical protein [Listeria monocytogenes]EAC2302924.1 hypothetical protein [Listeria monocytogenes]EAC5549432.1 hypothetical protein [Listeria monocytogenes]EAC5748257.1 hypothetical protein [Listeria monocytogenes]EAC7929685.1 hypothetical protein [Listeria monocytogenes]
MREIEFRGLFKIDPSIKMPKLTTCDMCWGTGTIKVLVAYARYNASDLTRAKYVDCPKCKGVEKNARINC